MIQYKNGVLKWFSQIFQGKSHDVIEEAEELQTGARRMFLYFSPFMQGRNHFLNNSHFSTILSAHAEAPSTRIVAFKNVSKHAVFANTQLTLCFASRITSQESC